MKTLWLLLLTCCISYPQSSDKTKSIYLSRHELPDGKYIVVQKNDKSGVIDSSDKLVVPAIYNRLDYKHGLLIATKNGKSGLITTNNRIITPIKYDWVLPRDNNRFLLVLNNKTGVTDTQNNEIIPLTYDFIDSFQQDYFIVQNNKGFSGIVDCNGKTVLKEDYKFYSIDGNKIFCTKDDKPIILNFPDTTANIYLSERVSFRKQERHYSTSELFNQVFSIDNKVGLLRSDNIAFIPPIYDDLRNIFVGRIFIVKNGGKYGVISYRNELLREIIYDNYIVRKEHVILKKNGRRDEIYAFEHIN